MCCFQVGLWWASLYTSSKLQAGLESPPNPGQTPPAGFTSLQRPPQEESPYFTSGHPLINYVLLRTTVPSRTRVKTFAEPSHSLFSCSWYLITLPPNYARFVFHPCHVKTIVLRCVYYSTHRLLQSSFSHPARRIATWLSGLYHLQLHWSGLAWAGGTLLSLPLFTMKISMSWSWEAAMLCQSKNLEHNGLGTFTEAMEQEFICSINFRLFAS